ncbi:MAG: nicotinate phosphoribosyltransferase [Synergistaceae bacterium]|jgi:nicotinate phosphoribosyltransferase|nr:nicotinate phosphoribosyltransferase [Synergistaceae bacterium]
MADVVERGAGCEAPIVKSLLENDLYKFSMWQALMHSHPGSRAEYSFLCRNKPEYPLAELAEDVDREIACLCSLFFSQDELDLHRSLSYTKDDFIDYLTVFRFQRRFVEIGASGGDLVIRAAGPLAHVMGFEIYVLYIISELYYRRLRKEGILEEARARLAGKVDFLRRELKGSDPATPFILFDFGLRRRYSGAWQREVVSTLTNELPDHFKGTSNVLLAKDLGITPVGTMAHEYMQAFQAFGIRLRDFQKASLEAWVQEFRGDLGTALTDVIGIDAFLADFDLYFAKLFDGLRHDSGDPYAWGEKVIAHYQKLRIDPRTKRLVFSDSLDLSRAMAIYRHFKGRIQTSFGIGTNLTNDTPIPALNIVMKMTSCNGQPVAKISDSPGKTTGVDPTFMAYLRQVFSMPE